MAAWLSEKRVVVAVRDPKALDRRLCNHSTSFMLCVMAMYLLLVVESNMISCRLEDQKTAPPSMMSPPLTREARYTRLAWVRL